MKGPERLSKLPTLGIGISTEYGVASCGPHVSPHALHDMAPDYAGFLEVGVEVAKGLDPEALEWTAKNRPTTYHFLDINLDEPEDFDATWMARVRAIAKTLKPAWMCGDAGLWHFGPRDRAHMLLLPPILSEQSADALADGVCRLRQATGFEVLPENPPGEIFLGNMHLLDYFGHVLDRADTGMLLDCAHLAIYQRSQKHAPLTGLDGFPLERVVELHVAGGSIREANGLTFVEDDHTLEVLPDTWAIFDTIIAQAPNLKAVVFECERNDIQGAVAGFSEIRDRLATHGHFGFEP